MASSRTFTLLCGLLAATLVGATLNPPAVLLLGPEIIREKLTQELRDHNAIQILQELPLLSTLREEPAGGIPVLGSLVNSVLNHVIWLKITSANIMELQVQPSADDQELIVNIPLDLVAGFNTPLVKSIVEIHMETEVQATIGVETSKKGLTLSSCSDNGRSLRISLLKKLSFMVNPLANGVMKLLVPALPKLVKSQLCPVIEEAFEDMQEDLLHLVEAPISVSSDHLQFDLLSSAIKDNNIQLNLGAKLLDSQGTETNRFSESAASLTIPALDDAPFSLTVRQDVMNAAVEAFLPSEELAVMLDSVLPELALRLKSSLKAISEKAAAQLGRTQIVKILTQEAPSLLLDKDSAKLAQMIVMEIFASNEVRRPFFTLGIEANSEAQFFTKGAQLMLNLNEISSDRIHLMNSDIALFDPEILKDIATDILAATLLPNQNGKLRSGIPLSIVRALGFTEASSFLTKDAIVFTSDSS
ncbi:BPI fold-containing family B member 1 [Myotis daubentonii]|uniref:BPI fold-containing family B member 1 n=1 Tax=Myotis daubentonii TaxID=98922 RepID=UPI0028730CD9|nr:BPI fold-containing family B member 1 [Myotis daubentonii]